MILWIIIINVGITCRKVNFMVESICNLFIFYGFLNERDEISCEEGLSKYSFCFLGIINFIL